MNKYPLIQSRTVTRYFFQGKGYATESAALKALAKEHCKTKAFHVALWLAERDMQKAGLGIPGINYPNIEQHHYYKAYETLFPHCKDGSCGYSKGGKCSESSSCDDETQDGIWCVDGFTYSWCKTARDVWIAKRVQKLKAWKPEDCIERNPESDIDSVAKCQCVMCGGDL